MARAGWFPDPGGQPGMFRYWNGVAWTDQLTDDPRGWSASGAGGAGARSAGVAGAASGEPGAGGTDAHAPGAEGPAAGGPGGSRPHSGGAPVPPGGQRGRRVVLLSALAAVLALVLLAVLVLPRVFGTGERPIPSRSAPTGSPTRSAWDETSRPSPTPTPTTPTPTPTPTPTKSPEISLPCPRYDKAVVNGRLYGGGLSVPLITDPRWSVNSVRTIPWAVCATGLQRTIAALWVSEVILAGVQPHSMRGSLRQQADFIAEDSLDRFYAGDVEFHQSSSKAITLEGLKTWELRYQVRVDYRDNIPGDDVTLLVVQHTDGSRSVLMTFATIGDTGTQTQVDGARAGLRVEKR